jgi:SAM-dependent methyltransferase
MAPVAADVADRRLERAARRWTGDTRTAQQLRDHYLIERELAERLRNASTAARTALYGEVYDDLFRRIPHHPQLRRRSSEERRVQVERELYFLKPYLAADLTFLEIGSGDLALARGVGKVVAQVHAVDVATEIVGRKHASPNVHVHLTDGRHIPLEDRSVALAYSNQLMEHLHPDDAAEHLREVFRVLRSGGAYLCVTPNRLTGPWDVSRMFSATPRGLHLREYSNRDLESILREVGFGRVRAVVPAANAARGVPASLFTGVERALEAIPSRARRAIVRGPWRKPLNSVRLLAFKPGAGNGSQGCIRSV